MNSDGSAVVMPSQIQCRYSSIRRRSTSVLGSSDLSAPPYIGVAVNLVSGAPQTGDAVAANVALPVEELSDRDVVESARFFDRHPAAAHGFDNSRLSLHC